MKNTEGGFALKKLDKPIKGQAIFQFKMQSKGGTWKNGFMVFGDSTAQGKLVKCGMYLGGNRFYSIIEGDYNSGPKQQKEYKGDPEKVFDIMVNVNVKTGAVTLNSSGIEVKYQLDTPLEKISYIGYGALQAETAFSEIKISR